MKYIIISIFLFGRTVVAQTTFFISPLINGKLYFCSYPGDQMFGDFYSEQNSFSHQNPYYTFAAKKVSKRPEINIGLRLGASFKDQKHILQIELSQDASGTMSKTSSFGTTNLYGLPEMPAYNTYGHGVSYFQNSFIYNRLTLSYGIRLTKSEFATKVYLTGDLSLLYGKKSKASWFYENDSTNTAVYYHNNAKRVSTEIYAGYWGKISGMVGIGVKADIGIKRNSRNLYLFTLETNLRHGFKYITYSGHITVINDNNNLLAFTNGLRSRGSGIYFQISRNFQLYPWRPNKKVKSGGGKI